MFCLDTNAVISAIGKRPESVDARLQGESSRGATLVTVIVREFRRVPRLPGEDWGRP